MSNSHTHIKRKVRNAYMVSTLSIALLLFLLGGVSYLIMAAMGATQRLKESVTIYVMLDELDPEQTTLLQDSLTQNPCVSKITYISKEAAAEEFKLQIGSDFLEFLEENPLPDSFEVSMVADSSESATLAGFEQDLLACEGVSEVIYQRSVIEQITTNINKFNLILLFFGGTLLFISLILLNNTIRVMIYSKRYIINTMKLVGATRGFIIKPFLRSSILQGFYAGLIAIGMLTLMIMGLHEGLPEVTFLTDQFYLLCIYGGIMLGGVLISLIFTAFAVRKFLRMNSNLIHAF